MDERALIGQSRYDVDDIQPIGYVSKEISAKGKAKRKALQDRNNSLSLDSGQGGHHIPSPVFNSPYPLPSTRIDGHAYTNPVFEDDYPPSPRANNARNDGVRGPDTRTADPTTPDTAKSSSKTTVVPSDRTKPDKYRTQDDSFHRDRNRGSIDKRRRARDRNLEPRGSRSPEQSRDRGARSRDVRPRVHDVTTERGTRKDDAGRRHSPESRRQPRDRTGADVNRRTSRSAERGKSDLRSGRSAKSMERTLSRLSGRNRKYKQLKDGSDSDYQNGDYRSDTSLPPNSKCKPKRQPSITSIFAARARNFIDKRIAESTSSRPDDALPSDVTDDSVFFDDSSVSAKSDTSRVPLEPRITIENETEFNSAPVYHRPRVELPSIDYDDDSDDVTKRTMASISPRHFTFDRRSDRSVVLNGDVTSPPLSPAPSELDEDLPDVMTLEDTDDMIVMLLSNRSPCVAKLIAFCGIMQIISGFITMISGASGFLSDITVFDFKFDSPIAFWCGVLFAFSGFIGMKTSHTKRRSINIFALGISFSAGCSALFVLVMTSDPAPIHDCKIERRVLYYFHLFLVIVEIMASSVLCFMCAKSLCEKSSQPNEVQILKTLSKYGLKPEHSVPQMAAAKAAAAKSSRPGTPALKSPNISTPKTPTRTQGQNANAPRSNPINNDNKPVNKNVKKNDSARGTKPEVILKVPNGKVIQPPPEVWSENETEKSRDRRSANQRGDNEPRSKTRRKGVSETVNQNAGSERNNQNALGNTNKRTDGASNGKGSVAR